MTPRDRHRLLRRWMTARRIQRFHLSADAPACGEASPHGIGPTTAGLGDEDMDLGNDGCSSCHEAAAGDVFRSAMPARARAGEQGFALTIDVAP